jgi:hypothetical protein
MKRRQQDSNLRATRCRRRASNALPCQLGHASVRASRRAPCGDARRAASGALSSDDLSGGRRAADSPGRRAGAPAHTRKCAAARARRRPGSAIRGRAAGRRQRKERESNPQGLSAHPFSRRDTAPVAVLPWVSCVSGRVRRIRAPSGESERSQWRESGPGRRRTCNPPLKRRELCRLSYGARDVTGRDRTCGASRFRRALYRAELRSRGSNQGKLLKPRPALRRSCGAEGDAFRDLPRRRRGSSGGNPLGGFPLRATSMGEAGLEPAPSRL